MMVDVVTPIHSIPLDSSQTNASLGLAAERIEERERGPGWVPLVALRMTTQGPGVDNRERWKRRA